MTTKHESQGNNIIIFIIMIRYLKLNSISYFLHLRPHRTQYKRNLWTWLKTVT